MSDKSPAPIRGVIVIEAPQNGVWRTLTSEETVPQWLGCMRYEARVGAVFFMQQDRAKAAADDIAGATHCEILALDAPSLFRFSWFVPGFPPTFVSFALRALSTNSTEVSFTHEGWEAFPPDSIRAIYDGLTGGWRSFVLPGLKRAVEEAQPPRS